MGLTQLLDTGLHASRGERICHLVPGVPRMTLDVLEPNNGPSCASHEQGAHAILKGHVGASDGLRLRNVGCEHGVRRHGD
eukprot:7468576-Alexandrium_andersonii.AAC.1